jgi:dethiobiotin synthetase
VSSRVFFIAGTDTDVGKTAVAAGLLRVAARAGKSTLAVKPVAAGCVRRGERLVNDDALALMQEASVPLDYADVNPVALEPAIAPHIAADRAQRRLSVQDLAEHCRRVGERDADWLVVEGAGGWLVPLNDDETLADLCQALGAEVILVVGMRLGCINHALLSVADLQRRGLRLAGWVANLIDPEMPELEANHETLERRIAAPCLGRVPHAPGPDLVETVAASLDIACLG